MFYTDEPVYFHAVNLKSKHDLPRNDTGTSCPSTHALDQPGVIFKTQINHLNEQSKL